MKALALDSSTEILCLCGRNGSRFFEVTRDVDIHHARWIVPMVDLVLTNLDLSPGELELVAAAYTNAEIGAALGISIRTVKTHIGSIYAKLGVKNRAQCVKLVSEIRLF